MKILISPQAFKESLSGMEAARAIEEGVLRALPNAQTTLIPIADGGDGTLETLVATTGGTIQRATVEDPLGRPITSSWGALGDGQTAMIEMSRASGLALLQEQERNPRITSTYGTGQLILEALNDGFSKLIIGIGGSATNDGGAGMAQSLGIKLLDKHGVNLQPGGSSLKKLDHIDVSTMDPRISEATIMVATDVSNILCGPTGASAVYGPQKGASQSTIEELDQCLSHFAASIKEILNIDIKQIPGSGAAGGLGAGLMAFLKADLQPGVDVVLETLQIESYLEGADLVITGEGQMDYQTVFNKAPIGIAKRAKKKNIPVIAIAGSLGKGYEQVFDHGIDGVTAAVLAPMPLTKATDEAKSLVSMAAERAIRLIEVGRNFDQ